ncbi:MAG TPA: hypothetical protein ENJ52_13455 [Aliiroseovarius sp.]|nr:hypothetical protein [Aliiroseovarius sp.]
MMNTKTFAVLGFAAIVSACTDIQDKTVDRQFGGKQDLSNLVAGIWIDPNGCQHWIIDDGLEGYLSARLDRYGKPVCTDAYPTGYAIGSYKDGQDIADFL